MSSGGPHFPQLSLQHAMIFDNLLFLQYAVLLAQVSPLQRLPPSACMHASLSAQVPEGGHAIGDATSTVAARRSLLLNCSDTGDRQVLQQASANYYMVRKK